jgi:hypothetical protein
MTARTERQAKQPTKESAMQLTNDQINHREKCASIIDKSHPEQAKRLRDGGHLHPVLGRQTELTSTQRADTEAFHAINAVMCPLP